MKMRIDFEEGQVMLLDKVKKFLVEADEPVPDFIQKKIDEVTYPDSKDDTQPVSVRTQ